MEKTERVPLEEIKKRVVKSFFSLTARQFAIRALYFATNNIILVAILSPDIIGVFNIGTAIITFFAFFSDIGLAASLIQKKEKIEKEDIHTVFTIQFLIVSILSLIVIFGAPFIANFYRLDLAGEWLIRALGFAFFLSSLKVVPAVLLERELKFQPLVAVEVMESVVFSGLLIFLSYNGFGLWAFSLAAISRGITGVVMIYILAPVRIGFGINKSAAKRLLSFGIPFQLNSLLALLKDRLVPLVVARIITAAEVGFVTWAQALAFLPLEIMNVIIRITFPAFSRLQEEKQSLETAVSKSLYLTSLAVYPALFGLGAVLPFFVTYVINPRWLPAVPGFYFFGFATFWAVISTTFTNVLNATGNIKSTLKLMVMWTALEWALTPFFVIKFGFLGVGIASMLISFTSIVTIFLVKRILNIKVLDAILLPTLASITMAVIVFFVSQVFVRNWLTFIIVIIFGALLYASLIFLFDRERIKQGFQTLRHA